VAVKDKGRKAIEKKNEVLEQLKIEYVPLDSITANDYNPNRQSEHDFELLLRSMREDGFTQPILVQRESRQIVDGEHRWRASAALGFEEIPVVFVDMTPEQARISTLRHNRARGSEDIELTAQVLRDLESLGALDWAQDSLMLDDIEIQRLLEDIPAPEALAGEDYTQGWVPDIVGDETAAILDGGTTEAREVEAGNVKTSVAMTGPAVEEMRKREKAIASAKTEEERVMARQTGSLYRVSLVFAGEEAGIVKRVLGKTPAEKLLELCMANDPGE